MTFDEIYEVIKDGDHKTAIDKPRLVNLYSVIQQIQDLAGDMAEAGVFRGGSAYLLLSASGEDRKIHLFDSFDGLPEPIERDRPDKSIPFYAKKGRFRTDCDKVGEFLSEFGGRVIIHRGWFEDTLRRSKVDFPDIKYAFVHLDVDLYQSYKECLEYFVPRIVPGGYLICDEYLFQNLPGAKLAIDEYFGDVESLDHWHNNIQLTVRL